MIGEFRENQFGIWHEWQPVLVGDPVRFTPDEGWPSRGAAERALIALAERTPHRPSSVAVLAVGDRFVARFVEDQHGGDLRPWHVMMETHLQDAQWVSLVDGPTMFVDITAQRESEDWCRPFLQGAWGAVPPAPDAFAPSADPALLARLYPRRTWFDGDQVHEWSADEPGAIVQHGTATFVTDHSRCLVTVTLGETSEVRDYAPATDDTMGLALEGSSSPLPMTRLTGDDAQPPR